MQLPQKEKDSRGVAAFSFGPVELAEALMPPLPDQQARTYIAGTGTPYRQDAAPHDWTRGDYGRLPLQRFGTGDDHSLPVWHGGMARGAQIPRREHGRGAQGRAMDLVYDTVNHLAFVSYKGGVTLRHVYRNETGTDSLVMSIQPWMWKTVFERGAAGIGDPVINLRIIADEVQSTCPSAVDAYTTLLDCRFDTATLGAALHLQHQDENRRGRQEIRFPCLEKHRQPTVAGGGHPSGLPHRAGPPHGRPHHSRPEPPWSMNTASRRANRSPYVSRHSSWATSFVDA